MLEDTASAMPGLLDHASELGATDRDPLLSGHSTGAYNAVKLALDRQWLGREGVPDDTVKGVAALARPWDFYPWDSDYYAHGPRRLERPAADPADSLRARRRAAGLLVNGDADETVKPRNSQVLAARQAELGARAEILVLPGFSHAGTLTHLARPFDRDRREIEAVMAFFDSIALNPASAAVQAAVS